jgi:formylglycine-generating enzyme required for sulfatase activity
MADVFISYSRNNTDFARRLFNSLDADGRKAWVDWQGIDYSTKWWEEICEGIESADNFLLVVSHDSLNSVYCHREIEHARLHNKRIIPFLYEAIDEAKLVGGWYTHPQMKAHERLARANWEAIKAIQWIDYPQKLNGDYAAAYAALIETVSTDPERKAMHTQLLNRLRDWDARGRNPDALLRGAELASYEAWLSRSDSASDPPYPTDAQRSFIATSRSADDERQRVAAQQDRRTRNLRRATIIAGIIGALAVIAGSLAFVSAQDARDQSHVAQTKEARALSVGATVESQSTLFALEQSYAATLAVGGVILPPDRPTQAPADFQATLTQVANLSQWSPVIAPDEYSVEMVQVPAGCFWMGSLVEQVEQPIREVCFDHPFWIDRFEVTNAQFDRLEGVALAASSWPDPNLPRTDITWFEARRFCEEVRRAHLPTEAQWEYAARGPTSRVYPWVGPFDEANAIYYYNAGQARDVGEDIRSGGRSWVGAYDMSGNVWEWTSSLYKPYPYNAADGREDPDNSSDFRIFRGGSFAHNDYDLRTAKRGWDQPGRADNGLGFRCARPN